MSINPRSTVVKDLYTALVLFEDSTQLYLSIWVNAHIKRTSASDLLERTEVIRRVKAKCKRDKKPGIKDILVAVGDARWNPEQVRERLNECN